MIVISEDGRGFEEIESWEDLFTRPGFVEKVDPNKIKTKDIIGRYRLPPDKHPCALTTCQQPHFRGYIVKLEGGEITNIGHICGERRFGVIWTQMERRFKRIVNEAQRREIIRATQYRVGSVQGQVQELREGEWGGDAIYKKIHHQYGSLLDSSTQRKLADRARAQNNIVNRVTRRTEEEIRDARIIGDTSEFNEEYVFTIAGIRALITYKKLRTILNTRLGSELEKFGGLDVDSLDYKELRQWSQWSDRIDTNLNDARTILEDCKRFLVPSNIAEINKYKSLL